MLFIYRQSHCIGGTSQKETIFNFYISNVVGEIPTALKTFKTMKSIKNNYDDNHFDYGKFSSVFKKLGLVILTLIIISYGCRQFFE